MSANFDITAVKLIAFCNELAEKTKNGFVYFKDVKTQNEERVIINEKNDAIVLDYYAGEDIVSDSDIFEGEWGVKFKVCNEDDVFFIECFLDEYNSIVIEDGRWYMPSYN